MKTGVLNNNNSRFSMEEVGGGGVKSVAPGGTNGILMNVSVDE